MNDEPALDDEPGGASLRYGNPWADPPEARDPLRRLRGRLVMPVTVWLARNEADEADGAAGADGADGAGGVDGTDGALAVGLTVSSALLSQGEPAMLAGLLSTDSDLVDALAASASGRFVVHLLGAAHRRLAQHFAGELPAPAELLVTRPSTHGPVLEAVPDRIYCRMTASRPFGWSLLVEAEVEQTQVGEAGKGLAWYHGAFAVLES